MIAGTLSNALLDYSINLLDLACEVTDRHSELGFDVYSEGVGPHLRHVIEHYEALLTAVQASNTEEAPPLVAYDARARDRHLERDSHVARLRLRDLQTGLQTLRRDRSGALDQVVIVRSLIGSAGQIEINTRSTLARELTFLASHTVHHFALLEGLASARGISFGINFGRAPATIANDQLQEMQS